MNFLGIDPGQSGALVLLSPEGKILSKAIMPIDAVKDLDKQTTKSLFELFASVGPLHIFFERIIPYAMNGTSALTFGRMLGMMEQMIWDMKIPITFIEAAKWGKEMHQGIDADLKPKAKSLIAFQRLFPGVDMRATQKSKNQHDGLVDALLIAEYGRRKLQQGK
jgi:crossover junction endodeoxyribonuclease RuvC